MVYVFECPACGQRIDVDVAMRDAILADGCPVCAADVTLASFFES